jgi:hypothetical protein
MRTNGVNGNTFKSKRRSKRVTSKRAMRWLTPTVAGIGILALMVVACGIGG